ncbi:hypothetical protein EsH8_VIII_001033 [Colletotrichum jinshuiense]
MATTSSAHPLASTLTPEFLASIVQARLPPNKGEQHNLSDVWTSKSPALDSEETRSQFWSALVALSKIPLPEMPDLMSFLPPPSDPDFPEQCLGLTLLVDQGPRLFCRGLDARWADVFFGAIARQLAHSWFALPADQRPDSWDRWRAAGASFEHWVLAHVFFSCPFVHSEKLEDHEIGLRFTEERRKAAEERAGEEDPYRKRRSEILSDATAFPRVVQAGPPRGEGATTQQWVFWSGMLMDVHWPIIQKFGRYPYRNAIQGRESTEEEVKWLDETEHFAEASSEVAEKVKEDIAAGRWTPLSETLSPI